MAASPRALHPAACTLSPEEGRTALVASLLQEAPRTIVCNDPQKLPKGHLQASAYQTR